MKKKKLKKIEKQQKSRKIGKILGSERFCQRSLNSIFYRKKGDDNFEPLWFPNFFESLEEKYALNFE
jgi:hypothetical protein